jgi:hypothetical protein
MAESCANGVALASLTTFLWRDILVIRDDGRAQAADYAGLLAIAERVQRAQPSGFGVLVIVPNSAVPPPDAARRAMRTTLYRVEKSIRCMCWLIEGSGFQASMARAVLVSMRLLSHRPYERHISMDLQQALTWMLALLDRGSSRAGELDAAITFVSEQLRTLCASDA